MGSKLFRKFKTREEKQAFFLLKRLRKAVRDFNMIEDSDRIILGLSGGKDSITLFKLLKHLKNIFKLNFEIIPVIILSELQVEVKKNLEPLKQFVKAEGYELLVKEIVINLPELKNENKNHCFLCSWHRRKNLFLTAKELNCNKVALGHHADDIAETTLLNLFYHGRLERMEPAMDFFDGEFKLIRPLAYINEKEIINYANKIDVNLFTCTCPLGSKTKRHFLKEKIHEIEKEIPKLKVNLFRAAHIDNFVPLRVKRKRKQLNQSSED